MMRALKVVFSVHFEKFSSVWREIVPKKSSFLCILKNSATYGGKLFQNTPTDISGFSYLPRTVREFSNPALSDRSSLALSVRSASHHALQVIFIGNPVLKIAEISNCSAYIWTDNNRPPRRIESRISI
jgi:hypothetical protein